MTDTRGPATGKVPPHVQDRLEEKRRRAAERARKGPVWARPPIIGALALVALLIGVAVGMGLSGDPQQAAADEIAEEVLPLANEAEALWRVGVAGGVAIADAAAGFEADADTAAIERNLEIWVDEHQRLLDEIDAVEVDPLAEPLRDLFHAYVRAQLDATVLLGAAASHEGSARTELFRASVREIGRTRALLREARLALAALGGPDTPDVEVPTVPGLTAPGSDLPEPFRGTRQAPDGAVTDGADTEDDAVTDDEAGAEPTPSPTP